MQYLPENTYDIKKHSNDYSKLPDSDYGKLPLFVEVRPRINSIPVREMMAGLRGYCFPALGVLYVREGDQDPDRVNYHENLHIQLYGQRPFHREGEVRELEYLRYGHENYN
ncbi:hypothetical protein ACFL96_20370 [Thermoproteota archaeon]